MPLPTYAWTDAQRQQAADLAAIWGAFGSREGAGVDAIYRPVGVLTTDPGSEVRVFLSEEPPRLIKPIMRAKAPTGTQRSMFLMAIIMEPGTAWGALGQNGGVSAEGFIASLRQGDTFEVPGIAAGRPADASVLVRVGQKPVTSGGVAWVAEVNP